MREYIELNGSDKQRAWAQEIKNNLLFVIEHEKILSGFYELQLRNYCERTGKLYSLFESFYSMLKNEYYFLYYQTSSSWFISNRNTQRLNKLWRDYCFIINS